MADLSMIDLAMVFLLGMHAGVFVLFMLTKDKSE